MYTLVLKKLPPLPATPKFRLFQIVSFDGLGGAQVAQIRPNV